MGRSKLEFVVPECGLLSDCNQLLHHKQLVRLCVACVHVLMNSEGLACSYGDTDEQLQDLINAGDADGDGELDAFEFYYLATGAKSCVDSGSSSSSTTYVYGEYPAGDESWVWDLFYAIDVDASGFVTLDEVRQFVQENDIDISDEQMQAFMDYGDTDGDGQLSGFEFYYIFTGVKSSADTASPGRSATGVAELPEGDIPEVYDLWRQIDADGSGTITLDELRAFVDQGGYDYSTEELQAIIDYADVDGDGMLSYQEFYFYLTWTFSRAGLPGGDTGCGMTLPPGDDFQAFMWFRAIDLTCSGTISVAEIRSFIDRYHFNDQDGSIEAILQSADADGDGVLTYCEWYRFWTGQETNAPETCQAQEGACPYEGQGAGDVPSNGDLHVVECDSECCCRLEVFYENEWGTICDDAFNTNAGEIACRQMGLPSTDVRIMVGGSGSGGAGTVPGTGQIWLDDVNCGSGSYDRLEDCPHKPYGSNNCDHVEDAGVCCGGEVSEVSGSSSQCLVEVPEGDNPEVFRWFRELDSMCDGRIELAELREWASDSGYSIPDDQLQAAIDAGDSDGDGMLSYTEFYILVTGYASVLDGGEGQCMATVPEGDYETVFQFFYQIDLDCSGAVSEAEINSWAANNGIDIPPDVVHYIVVESDSDGDGVLSYIEFYYMIAEVRSVLDTDRGNCPAVPPAPENPLDGDLMLAECHEDCCCRVDVFHDGEWGSICDDSFNLNAGIIVCRQIGMDTSRVAIQVGGSGYGGSAARSGTSPGTGQIWLDDVNCGDSSLDRLEDCPHKPYGSNNCEHHEDAGVCCGTGRPTSTKGSAHVMLKGSPSEKLTALSGKLFDAYKTTRTKLQGAFIAAQRGVRSQSVAARLIKELMHAHPAPARASVHKKSAPSFTTHAAPHPLRGACSFDEDTLKAMFLSAAGTTDARLDAKALRGVSATYGLGLSDTRIAKEIASADRDDSRSLDLKEFLTLLCAPVKGRSSPLAALA